MKTLKLYYDKYTRTRSYAFDKKVWLNSKYIKTISYCKVKAKFFEVFRLIEPILKQVYKLLVLNKWKIYNVFYMSFLK